MLEFFRGWKRKTGCVTLVLACAFAAGWVRSLLVIGTLNFFGTHLVSSDGWIRQCDVSFITTETSGRNVTAAQLTPVLSIPYWSIVIPLTLLSAWLLLSKPRAGKVEAPSTN